MKHPGAIGNSKPSTVRIDSGGIRIQIAGMEDDDWGPLSEEDRANAARARARIAEVLKKRWAEQKQVKRNPPRRMSAKALVMIAEAQKRRWAKLKKAEPLPKAKRVMSASARAHIAKAQKKRWAARKETAKAPERSKASTPIIQTPIPATTKERWTKVTKPKEPVPKKPLRRMSAEALAKIAEAQKRRWAAMKLAKKTPKRTMTATARALIAAAAKARWAKVRTAEKDSKPTAKPKVTTHASPVVDPLQPVIDQIRREQQSGKARFVLGYIDPKDKSIHRVKLQDITFSSGEYPFITFVDETGQQRGMQQSRICEVYRNGWIIWKRSSTIDSPGNET